MITKLSDEGFIIDCIFIDVIECFIKDILDKFQDLTNYHR